MSNRSDLSLSSANELQQAFCQEHKYDFVPSPGDSKSGFAVSTRGRVPINGLRHPAAGDTNGWYIWCGEVFSEAADFFSPMHVQHIYEEYPELVRLFGLAPGYRFLVAGEYLDVWYDPLLLHV